MRTRLYRSKRISEVIRELFFVGGSKSFAHSFDQAFPRFMDNNSVMVREVPVTMVALVATGVSTKIFPALWSCTQ
jgi:hypothetical protein